MSRRRASWSAVVVAAGLALAGCANGGGSGAGSEDTYLVMVSAVGGDAGPLTDILGTAVVAAKAAAKVIKQDGGVAGRRIEIVSSPDNADPTKALTALRAQIAERKPDTYLVAGGTNLSAAVAPILKQNGILFMNSGTIPETGDPEQNPLAFNLAPLPDVPVDAFVPEFKANDYHKIGIIHGNSVYAQEFSKLAKDSYAKAGFDVVGVAEYDAAALDMTPQLSALQAKAPDVLVLNGYGAPVGYLLKGLAKLGWDVPVLGETSVAGTSLVALPPPDGVLGTPEVEQLKIEVMKSVIYDPAAKATNAAVEAMTSVGEIRTSLIQAWNYDGLMLVAAAAKAVGSADDPAKLAAALEDRTVTGGAKTALFTSYNFSADSHNARPDPGDYSFTPPTKLVNGQFGHPDS